MKRLLPGGGVFLIVCVCLHVPVSGNETRLVWQQPLPFYQSILAMQWLSPDHGFICGSWGELMETTDGGATWNRTLLNLTGYLAFNDVFFLDSDYGWAVGRNGGFWRTTNGGSTWVRSVLGNELHGVHFSDQSYGTVVGVSKVMRTNDGGVTWTTFSMSGTWYDAWFHSPAVGWVAGSVGIRYTDSGGAFWTNQYSSPIYALDFLDTSRGWACGPNGVLLKTENGGSTWQSVALPGSNFHLNDVDFLNDQEGWVVGDLGNASYSRCVVYHTTDGGSSWSSDTLPRPAPGTGVQRIYAVTALDTGSAVVAGFTGMIYSTQNGGETWELIGSHATGHYLRNVFFRDVNHGWAVGSGGASIRTQDGGATWEYIPTGVSNNLESVYFMEDLQTGWAAGTAGRILRTQDGGSSWQQMNSGITSQLYDIEFNSSGFGVAVGVGGTAIQSHDYGQTWNPAPVSSPGGSLFVVSFAGETSGYAAGYNGTSNVILRFDDSGDSWCDLNNPHPGRVLALSVVDANTVWAGCEGSLLYSVNGGGSWTRVTFPNLSSPNFEAIHFPQGSHGYAMDKTTLLLTIDDWGQTFTVDSLGPGISPRSAYFLSPDHIWVAGGGVLKLQWDPTGVWEFPGTGLLPALPMISIAPNPIRATAAVSFTLTCSGPVVIRVMDLAGRVVEERSLGFLQHGEHSIPLMDVQRLGDLPSGLYFCTVQGAFGTLGTRFIRLGR